MKKVSVKKEILTIALIIIAILIVGTKVFATGASDNPIQIPVINTSTNSVDANTQTNETTTNIMTITNTLTTPITPTTNTTGSTYQNTTTLPQTGDASDYAIFMVIAVAVIVAIYAYKKVREYNIK